MIRTYSNDFIEKMASESFNSYLGETLYEKLASVLTGGLKTTFENLSKAARKAPSLAKRVAVPVKAATSPVAAAATKPMGALKAGAIGAGVGAVGMGLLSKSRDQNL